MAGLNRCRATVTAARVDIQQVIVRWLYMWKVRARLGGEIGETAAASGE